MPWDFAIVESGNGGDLTLRGNDIGVYYNNENEIYLRLFGGNIEADTPSRRQPGVIDRSYWANDLLFGNDPAIQFNSLTERTLDNTELSSQGLGIIEAAIKKDLDGLDIDVSVDIISTDKVRINLKQRLPNGTVSEGSLIYNNRTVLLDFDPSDFSMIDFN